VPQLLAAAVPDSLLTVLRVIFLILLYLFFIRVIRAVWSELKEPKGAPAPEPRYAEAAPAGQPRGREQRARGHGERLVVLEPAERKGQVFELGDELTMGRAEGCGVSLPDDTFVSQVHARVFRRDGSLFVEDLGSTNGTFLNRKAVSGPVALRKGDRVQVGRSVLEVTK
jgi:pSer/pThr/pTyr-binding forkhead associated (FHA) protein